MTDKVAYTPGKIDVAFEPGKHIIIGCDGRSEIAGKPRCVAFIPNNHENDLEPEREPIRLANAQHIVKCWNEYPTLTAKVAELEADNQRLREALVWSNDALLGIPEDHRAGGIQKAINQNRSALTQKEKK